MFSLLLLEKSGAIVEKKVKSFDRLFGLCNYRNEDGFELLHEWSHEQNSYGLYGKRKGKQNGENKSVLLPPLTEDTFYGTLCLVKKTKGEEQSLTLEEWNKFTQFTQSLEKEDIESKIDEKELKKEPYEE
jgi:hypothetical protein